MRRKAAAVRQTPADHRRPRRRNEIHNRLYSRDGQRHTFTCQRLPGSYHGSGCTWPAPWPAAWPRRTTASAVRSALDYTWRTLRDAEQLGKGQFVPRRLPLDFCS
jgi:hydroxymethylpyrimidine/phosphomethylpyrimidine kinase